MKSIGIAIIGAGSIALANHLPGLALTPARVVALCDTDPAALDRASRQTGVAAIFTDYQRAIAHPGVDAVIIATPNFLHPPIVFEAAKAQKHVLCEKPLALDFATALQMYRAAQAAGVRHMTAFTYRFVPAMRYMKHLVDRGDIGAPVHFRAQRFQDWGTRPLGWRQIKKLAGSGEMGDMLSHRIDYGHHLIGPIARLVADLKTIIPNRGGSPSDVDDWVAMICEFATGGRGSRRADTADPENPNLGGRGFDTFPPPVLRGRAGEGAPTGVFESTKLASGRGEGHHGQDIVEINGTEGSIVYSTQRPLELQLGKSGDADLHRIEVPREFLVWPRCPRDPSQGDPLATFRYDQDFEFIDAILNQRDCRPSFRAGAMAQAVMDTIEKSAEQRRWVEVPHVD